MIRVRDVRQSTAVSRGSKCLGGACFPIGGKRRPQGLLGCLDPREAASAASDSGTHSGIRQRYLGGRGSRREGGDVASPSIPIPASAPEKPLLPFSSRQRFLGGRGKVAGTGGIELVPPVDDLGPREIAVRRPSISRHSCRKLNSP